MFSILDTAVGIPANRPKTSADRACDQCKRRKVRCIPGGTTKQCLVCSNKGFSCTYDKARKKRGPAGKAITEIRRSQSISTSDGLQFQPLQSPTMNQVQEHSTIASSPRSANSDEVPLESMLTSNSNFVPEGVQQAYWHSGTTPRQTGDAQFFPTYPETTSSLRRTQASGTANTVVPGFDPTAEMPSPNPSEFVFPSLPIDSPSDGVNAFGAIMQQDLPPLGEITDVWPKSINEETLLPWIDVYFKRLHPTVPILNRTSLYCDMVLRKHRADRQYGAMLLGLCAFAMTQPVQIHERASRASRSVQARMLMEECVKMRVAADFGENPTIETILASFFLFACLFGSNQHNAARLRLREAVDLAHSLGLQNPQLYEVLEIDKREQWLRTYLVLSVTERAYALQQRHSIEIRGRPGITAGFMGAFDATATTEYISSLIYQDQSDAVAMTGLLYLMSTFDAIDENIMDCWNDHCRYSDGSCEWFDRRRALQMFRAQYRAREACLAGNIPFAPSAKPLPLSQLIESQQADISITQFWLLNRLWNLCMSHQLLREASDHPQLRYDFACQAAGILLAHSRKLSLAAMEVHGVGMAEKICDVALGVTTAMNACPSIMLDTVLAQPEPDVIPIGSQTRVARTVRELLEGLKTLLQDFRGGDHPYSLRFAAALDALPTIQHDANAVYI